MVVVEPEPAGECEAGHEGVQLAEGLVADEMREPHAVVVAGPTRLVDQHHAGMITRDDWVASGA